MRTELFYFKRITGHSLTVEDVYKPIPTPAVDESHTLTFAELKDLIEQDKTDQIPNNRHIPEAINVNLSFLSILFTFYRFNQDAPPSESTVPSRKKPWEFAVE